MMREKGQGCHRNSIRFLSNPFHWRGILSLTLAVEVGNIFAMLCRVPFMLTKFFDPGFVKIDVLK